MLADTAYALSTVPGKSGIAVIRIVGPRAYESLGEFGVTGVTSRKVKVAHLKSPISNEVIDEAVILYFQGPNTFTGDDIVELQTHGSQAVIHDLLEELSKIAYLRLAEPGEFSKRAFLNGRMDLTQAEGLAQLIEAETAQQRKLALRQMSGELQSLYEKWRRQMVQILAQIEAYIDFPDDDIPDRAVANAITGVEDIVEQISKHLQDNHRGEVIMQGVKVAIFGPPNAGKSSLLNLLAQRDAAIVSEIAGTTRDIISVKVDLKGFPVILYDTAGIRESTDVIEQEGVKRALAHTEDADLRILVVDSNDINATEFLQSHRNYLDENTLVVFNKVDLQDIIEFRGRALAGGISPLPLSTVNGKGVDELVNWLAVKVQENFTPAADPVITKARYREALYRCIDLLTGLHADRPLELVAEDIRLAANQIGIITGRIDVEEILDEIFGSFCIGK
jgi:tRNA modification GTPase